MIASLRPELRPMLRLAVPVVFAELGWMGMGVVDAVMVGRIDAESLGAVSLGRAMFVVVAVLGVGLLLGMDTLVSRAFGAGNLEDCRRSLVHGVYLALLMAGPATLLLHGLAALLLRWDTDPTVRELAVAYLRTLTWSALPIFLYTAFRRYLQAVNRVRAVMVALISANLINLLFNWVFIFGRLGAPALGVRGAAWATLASMCYMALFLLVATALHERSSGASLWRIRRSFDGTRMAALLRLGLPAAGQLLLEVGAFATGTALAGRLDAASLAAHHIALTAASLTAMVPLGISSAAAVRVGQALGRRDPEGSARAGWTALLFGAAFMGLAALVFVLFPRALVRGFTTDAAVIAPGVSLLLVAAVFQLFDGVQMVATGALRGAGNTRTPMVWNLVGYWLLGLPLGYWLCFVERRGAVGLWIGLALGLIVVGVVLLRVWALQARTWRRLPAGSAV